MGHISLDIRLNNKPGAGGVVKQLTIDNEAKSNAGIEQGALNLTLKFLAGEYDKVQKWSGQCSGLE